MGGVDMKYGFFTLFFLFLQGILIFCVAPCLLGWIKQVKCWLQNRSAPPILQPYFELRTLLMKRPVVAENASWLFQLVPYFYFACLVSICFALPFISGTGLI